MPFILSLAEAEGWNPGLSDGIPFYHTDPKGFFIGKLGDEKIGCISAVSYTPSFGFLGLYILKPPYRGKGFGIQLWNRALAHLGIATIGLDGVVQQQENYKKSGFQLFCKNGRFRGKIKGRASSHLTSLDSVSLEELAEYDTPLFGVKRERFLKEWIAMPNSTSLAKREGGQITGYGLIRRCKVGHKIGPLFADTAAVAEELLLALIAKSRADEIFIDVTDKNPAALALVNAYRLDPVFETARMYKGNPPKQELSKVFGITTFELG